MTTPRWERREKKKQAERDRMPKSGMSVRLIHQIIGERAAREKAKAAKRQEQERSPKHGVGTGPSIMQARKR